MESEITGNYILCESFADSIASFMCFREKTWARIMSISCLSLSGPPASRASASCCSPKPGRQGPASWASALYRFSGGPASRASAAYGFPGRPHAKHQHLVAFRKNGVQSEHGPASSASAPCRFPGRPRHEHQPLVAFRASALGPPTGAAAKSVECPANNMGPHHVVTIRRSASQGIHNEMLRIGFRI